jgi:phospholipase C
MVRPKLLILWFFLACLAAIMVSLEGCSGTSNVHTIPPPPPGKIEHVVIIFQENRTPDNLFQGLCTASGSPGCGTATNQYDISSTGVNSLAQTITLMPIDLGTNGSNPQNYDLSHAHKAFEQMYDNGAMDGADQIMCGPSAACSAHPNPQFMYVEPSDVQPYLTMAQQYTFGDHMFQTNQGPSMPAHQYILAGTSWDGTAGSTLFQSELPTLPTSQGGATAADDNTGCAAPASELVQMIDISNPSWPANETATMYPCWEHPTLTDLLDAQKISWRYYANSPTCVPPAPCPPSGIWVAPNAIQHMCHASGTATGQPCDNPEWISNIVIETQILNDIPAGNLPAVSWVIPDGKTSDHAAINDGEGPSWVASIVNAIGTSQYWKNTAIIITWDDWGGWYDHVPPPVISSNNSYQYGFRVPLVVVSPYAKAHYISHQNHDFGSILKFVEETFSLPQIDPTVTIGSYTGFADSNALDDLSDCFDYTQTPITFQTIPSQYDAKHFLDDQRPPSDPDDD